MSMKTTGELIIIGCGGAGINVVGNLKGPLNELGSGFAKVRVEYIDTSLSNIRNFDHDDNNFHLVKANGVSREILGSGGDRVENSKDIVESVKEFIDKRKFTNAKVSTYYVVVGSASGGSGSVIAPMVVKNLLERGLPVISTLIGDSSSGLSTRNTHATLATFNSIAKMTKKPINMIYNDNSRAEGNNVNERLTTVDKDIFKHLSAISLFISGENTSIDQKDMAMFIDQASYASLNIKPGLYGIGVFVKDVNLPTHITPVGARTLTTPDVSSDINLEMLEHYKAGTVDDNNVINTFRGQFPIHLVSYSNSFSAIEMELKNKIEMVNAAAAEASVDDINNGTQADEDGLMF